MRLIDADKLEIKETVRIQLCGLKEYVALYSFTKEQIEEAPTVKAIPIEWILKYRFNNRGEITYYSIDAIDHMLSEWCEASNIDMWDMIDKWEKENEIDKDIPHELLSEREKRALQEAVNWVTSWRGPDAVVGISYTKEDWEEENEID